MRETTPLKAIFQVAGLGLAAYGAYGIGLSIAETLNYVPSTPDTKIPLTLGSFALAAIGTLGGFKLGRHAGLMTALQFHSDQEIGVLRYIGLYATMGALLAGIGGYLVADNIMEGSAQRAKQMQQRVIEKAPAAPLVPAPAPASS